MGNPIEVTKRIASKEATIVLVANPVSETKVDIKALVADPAPQLTTNAPVQADSQRTNEAKTTIT
jgi:hypothetical protein